MNEEDQIYKRIGEFVVAFQWLENRMREIGGILDPDRKVMPSIGLKGFSNKSLINKVHELFLEALPKCGLAAELEADFKKSFKLAVNDLHQLRQYRNRMLHSAFIELKAGGEVFGLLRSDPKIQLDEETGQYLFDQEILAPVAFSSEMKVMTRVALF